MTHYLYIDTENVGNSWIPLMDQADADTVMLLFYTAQTSAISMPQLGRLLNFVKRADVQLINCTVGKNALDFQLVTALGHRFAQDTEAEYIIYSSDTGYDAVVSFWRERGCRIRRVPAGAPLNRPAQQTAPNANRKAAPKPVEQKDNKTNEPKKTDIKAEKPVETTENKPAAEKSPDVKADSVDAKAVSPAPQKAVEGPSAAAQPVESAPNAAKPEAAPEAKPVETKPAEVATAPLYGRITVHKDAPQPVQPEAKPAIQPEKPVEVQEKAEVKQPEEAATPLYGRIVVYKDGESQKAAQSAEKPEQKGAQPLAQPEKASTISTESKAERKTIAQQIDAKAEETKQSVVKTEAKPAPAKNAAPKSGDAKDAPKAKAAAKPGKKPAEKKATPSDKKEEPKVEQPIVAPAPISPVVRIDTRTRPETVINAVPVGSEGAIADALKKADEAAHVEDVLHLLQESIATDANRRMQWIYRALLKKYGQKHGIVLYNAIRDKVKNYCRTLEKTATEA